MRRKQCKYCNKDGFGETGRVIHEEIQKNCRLPGPLQVPSARVYTVECSNCGHTWKYRRKIK